MKIVFLAGYLSRRASGVRQTVEALSRALFARDHDVHVLGLEDVAWSSGDAALWQGGPVRVAPIVGPRALGWAPGLWRELALLEPDVLHLHGLWTPSSALAANWARRREGALVISPHGMLAPHALTYSPFRKKVAGLLYQERCFAAAAGYQATADAEACDIQAVLGNVPVAVVPNGVDDTSVSLPNYSERAKRVVAIGRLHPVKGYDRLLRAWAQVEQKSPGWTLEIAGPDPDGLSVELRQLSSELGLARATIGSPRYGAQRDELIAGSRLFALPSLSENFAMTVPEALVCGTPVLASWGSPWRALPEKGCGWWVDSKPDVLADALLKAMTTPETRLSQMGNAGRAWTLREFGWDAIAARMEEFYSTLVRGGIAR